MELNWTNYPMVPATSTNHGDQPAEFFFDFGMSDWGQLNFDPMAPYATDASYTLSPFSSLESPTNFDSLLLSPPGFSEPSSSPTLPSPPTPDSLLEGSSSVRLPTAAQNIPRSPTPPAQAQEAILNKIEQFDLCPWTRHGQKCGYVSWARSGYKQIKRHLKAEHFPDTSLGYECPNPRCTHKNNRFLRKDACNEHRRGCDLMQVSGYVPLASIISGNDVEVNRWMKARRKPRVEIIKKLRNGTPWSDALLQPVSI